MQPEPLLLQAQLCALAQLSPAERIQELARPGTRSAILGEKDRNPHLFMEYFGQNFAGMYPGADKSSTICRKKAIRFRRWPTQPASHRWIDV
jgi:hypothetical protein